MMVCPKNPKDFVLQENHWIKKKDFVHTSHSYHLQVIIKNKRKRNHLILFVLDVLNLLEKKKKLVKKNGLLQFVLWREAYRLEIFLDLGTVLKLRHELIFRGERDRASEIETRSAKKFLSMARRRKRSPFQSVKNKI